jgi:hypothetical protein
VMISSFVCALERRAEEWSTRRAPRGKHRAGNETRSKALAKRQRWHVHFTPTGASWINQVERFFALLTEKQIRHGIHRSTMPLEADIRAFIEINNENPRPFRWTKSAVDILDAVKRFCLRTLQIADASESGY